MVAQAALFGDESYKASLSQWYTPAKLAEQTVRWALEGVERPLRILEPSAGLGALIRPIPAEHRVTVYELDEQRIGHLEQLPQAVKVRQADFLTHPAEERFDLGLMNPPYEGGQDSEHVHHALLCCDRVVAVLRLATLSGVRTFELLWSFARLARMAITVSRPRFSGPQSLTPSGGTAVVELVPAGEVIGRGEARGVEVEWW